MLSLGYSEYVTQAGDWGHFVRHWAHYHSTAETNKLNQLAIVDARLFISVWSPACQGYAHQFSKVWGLTPHFSGHFDLLSTISAAPLLFKRNPIRYVMHLFTPYTQREREGVAAGRAFRLRGNGYLLEQSTRPQTLGYALADSPVGLLAWIYEKLVQWTDSYPWTDEEGGFIKFEHPSVF